MDLAPFARMDDPVPLTEAVKDTKPIRRKKFNEDDDDDDDDEPFLSKGNTLQAVEETSTGPKLSTDLDFVSSSSAKNGLHEVEEEKKTNAEEQAKDQDDDFGLMAAADLSRLGGETPTSFQQPSSSPKKKPVYEEDNTRYGEYPGTPTSASNMPSQTHAATPTSVSSSQSFVQSSPFLSEEQQSISPVKQTALGAGGTKRPLEESHGDISASSSTAVSQRNRAMEPSVFWADHREWLRSIAPIDFCSVDEPLQMARTLTNPNPPTTYLVKTSLNMEGVRRRYSDFELVRNYLTARYPGILLLALPEKKAVGNSSVEFLKERAKGLEMFLRVLLDNEYLRADPLVRSFLQAIPSEWESVKKRTTATPLPTTPQAPPTMTPGGRGPTQSPAMGGGQSSSEERWRAAVHMSRLPEKYEEEVRKSYEVLSKLELGLKSLVQAAQKCVQTSRQYASAVKDLHRQFAFALSAVQSPMEFWSESASLEPILMEELLLEALQREMELVSEMKRMLDQRKELVVLADQKLAVLHKYEDERQQNEKTGQMDRAMRSAQKVQDAQKQLKQADYKLEMVSKALFLAGLSSFAPARLSAISSLLGRFAFGELRFGDLMKSVWLGVVASLRLDLTMIEGEAHQPMENVRRRVPEKFRAMFTTKSSHSSAIGNGKHNLTSAKSSSANNNDASASSPSTNEAESLLTNEEEVSSSVPSGSIGPMTI